MDDNDTLRTVTALALRAAAYDVSEARSVKQAQALAADVAHFDLFVLDIRLEDGTGVDIFEAAGGHEAGPPTLFISGYSGDEISNLPPSGRWDFISKPFSREALLASLDQLVERTTVGD
ncbi:MAG: response regulator [Chloroflexi bacterium]|nr:response regulator [Chloroflexota bacterium]